MASRTAKVAWSIVAGILAGVPLIAPRSAANAAECLTEPGKTAPQGQHWHYHIERGTKRHCWYTRDDGAKAAEAGSTDDESAQQAPKQAPQTAETSEDPSRSVEDARAEYPMPQARANTVAAPAPAPAPLPAQNPAPLASSPNPQQADAQGSTIASRWPSPETAVAPPAIAPAAPQVTAAATDSAPAADAPSDAPADTAAPALAPAPAAAVTAPARPQSVSLQMLFAVIGGALALAGLTASIIYRFGRRRQQRLDTRERRAVLWDGVETGPTPPWIEPVMEAETAPQPLPERRAPQVVRSQQRYEKIEEILAQLVKQGQQSDA